MILNSFIDFCFDWGENEYVTVNNYGACWVKNIKDTIICLKKQQIKDAIAHLLFNFYFTVGPKIFYQIIGIPMRSDPAPFFPTYSYTFMKVYKWMNELKKNELIKARKFGNVFRFINYLNSLNDGGEFENSYCNI